MKSTFGLHAAIVVIVAVLAVVWLGTKPGDHSAMNLFIGGLVSGYLKLAYDAEAAKLLAAQAAEIAQKTEAATQVAIGELVEVKGKLHQVGREVDGKLLALLEATGAQKHAEGRLEEAEEERQRQLTASALSLQIGADASATPAALSADATAPVLVSIVPNEDAPVPVILKPSPFIPQTEPLTQNQENKQS